MYCNAQKKIKAQTGRSIYVSLDAKSAGQQIRLLLDTNVNEMCYVIVIV